MEQITVRDILAATGGTLLCGSEDTEIKDICIDSREIKAGDLFVPLIGEKVNPHQFIEQVMEVGAATLTQEHFAVSAAKPYIRVENTYEALTAIGNYLGARLSIPVIAVTGSVGKTTTRHMIATALASDKHVLETLRNYNSQVGVPIMLGKIEPEHEVAVLECGMSEVGQIHILSEMIRPHMAVVSTIGVAHIEQLKSKENICREKLSIVDGMDPEGILFLNGDDPMLKENKDKIDHKVITYGLDEGNDYRGENLVVDHGRTYFDCVCKGKRIPVELSVLGNHNVRNCLAALAVADACGVDLEKAAATFAHFQAIRQNIIRQENKYTIIDDTYNASPDSMKASLDVLCEMECTGRRVAVLADMLELGEDSVRYHYELGEYLSRLPVDELLVVGPNAKYIAQAVKDSQSRMVVHECGDNEDVVMLLLATLHHHDIVLIKGSNGMNMRSVVKTLQQ